MSDASGPSGPEQQAVKTTIAEGQPAGNAWDTEAVPVGLEHVLALAAVHAEFRQALRQDPDTVLEAAGLVLTPTERAILSATTKPALDQMIVRVDANLSTPDRRQFLERATAALVLLIGGHTLAGCDSDKAKQYGKPKPGPPPARPTQPVQMHGERSYEHHGGGMGIRPNQLGMDSMDAMDAMDSMDAMDAMDAMPAPTHPSNDADMAPPKKKKKRKPRPYRPASMGVRPRRREPASMGVRPSRSRRRIYQQDPLDGASSKPAPTRPRKRRKGDD